MTTRAYALAHPVVVILAAGAAIAGFLFLVEIFALTESALGEWLPPHLIPIWAAVYCAGGTLILLGIFSGRPNVEAPGLVLLGSALLASALAVFSVRGINPGLVAGSTIGPVSVGCLVRAVILTFIEPRVGVR